MSQQTADASDSTQPWQGEWVERASTIAWIQAMAFRCLWPALVLTSVALFASFIWLLMLAPKRTPVLVLDAAPYAWPLPPTEFSREDIESLSELDGQTISVSGGDVSIRSRRDFLRQLSRSLHQAEVGDRSTPRIVYLNLHGVAGNNDEHAYLIPPAGSPNDPETWVRLEEVFAELQTVEPTRNTLLVLDCQHMDRNWNVGLKANRFASIAAARINDLLAGGACENTAVLLTCSEQQRTESSPHLRHSICGHFFRLGVAGAADTSQDGWVSLRELDAFVTNKVSAWVRRHRGTRQTPQLLAAHQKLDFKISRSLNASALKEFSKTATAEPVPNVPRSEIDSLWAKMDEIRSAKLYQNEPIAFSQIEHKLLSLEQLTDAGLGYREAAVSLCGELNDRFAGVEKRRALAGQAASVHHAYTVLSGDHCEYPTSLPMHSLSLGRLFGDVSPKNDRSIGDAIRGFEQQPNKQTLAAALQQFKSTGGERYATAQFLRMLHRYQTPRLWNRRELIGRLVGLQREVHRLESYSFTGGIPTDGRLHQWTRSVLKGVDRTRRDAEDWVFLSDTAVFREKLGEFESTLSQCERAVDVVREAYETDDKGCSALGYLAQWADTPQHPEFAGEQEMLEESILVALRGVHDLASRLSMPEDENVLAACDRISELTQDVQLELDGLTDRVRRRSDWLINQANLDDPLVLSAIENLLACPMLDASSRGRLRTVQSELAARLFEQGGGADQGDVDSGQAALACADWSQHPLDVFFSKPDDQPWTVRMQRFAARLVGRQEECVSATSLRQQNLVCAQQANDLRIVAPIGVPALGFDPLSDLRTNHLQGLLAWHADRAVVDFWGPAGRRRPFYDDAAMAYCRASSKLGESRGSVQAFDEIERVSGLLQATRRFLPNWLATSTGPGIQIDSSERIRSELTVLSNTPDGFAAPSGTASVTVRDAESSIEIAQVTPSDAVILPTIGGRYTMLLPDSVANRGEQLVAQAMFRGHEYGRPLRLPKLAGYKVRVEDEPTQTSSVTVTDGLEGAAIGFVIDGSASMGEELEAGKTKLSIAKAALKELLAQVADRGDTQVSVHAFGHRVGWSTTKPVQLLRRPGTASVDQEVMPSRDVESLLGLRPFGNAELRQLSVRVDEVSPWGQSPLYLAMERALTEFQGQTPRSKRFLIVITDGENYQFALPTDTEFEPTTAEAVLRRSREVNVPIHILGLGVDGAREPATVAEFEQLSSASDGGFQALDSATDLNETLEQLLLNPNYRVRSVTNPNRAEFETRLGQEVRMQVGATAESFEVSVDASDGEVREKIQLEGGESIQLYVDKNELLAFPFDRDVAQWVTLIAADGSTTDTVLRVHRPVRLASGDAIFRVSWQRNATAGGESARWKATKRPEAYWIEVQPCDAESQSIGAAFVFYDRKFEKDVAVPLVKLTAEEWPRDAKKARVRVWTRPASSEMSLRAANHAESVSQSGLSESIVFDPARAEPITLPKQVFVRMESLSASDSYAIRHRFVLRFDDREVAASSIKILPESDSVSARILRQFDEQHGIAVHTFEYQIASDAPQNYRVSDRVEETKNAWTSPSEILVDVPDPGGLLPAGLSARRGREMR